MKVDVLQVKQAKFRNKFCWWSNWIDIAVYNWGDGSYLIQMKVSRTNKKKFHSIHTTGRGWGANTNQVGDLTQMSKEGKNDE